MPIRRVPVAELRGRVSLVLQDVFLFSEDVASNIRLGETDIPDERVRAGGAAGGRGAVHRSGCRPGTRSRWASAAPRFPWASGSW